MISAILDFSQPSRSLLILHPYYGRRRDEFKSVSSVSKPIYLPRHLYVDTRIDTEEQEDGPVDMGAGSQVYLRVFAEAHLCYLAISRDSGGSIWHRVATRVSVRLLRRVRDCGVTLRPLF